ncbi:MAG: aldo/keto reductase [Myxococcales bacterium]|nr:aldo/keto reductase [Myxococcales bacterium]
MVRPFGSAPFPVPALGLGAGHLGGPEIDDAGVDALIGAALDAGVTVIDVARSYGQAEERLGRALAGRRDAFVLATKGGYGTPGIPDWTGPCITAGVDAALQRLRTDRLEVFFLHSCPRETLERGEVVEALAAAVRAGKVQVMGYSGEGEALAWAVASGRFGAIETSVNVCDQRGLDEVIPRAARGGMGVIAKRPLANAPWRFDQRPVGDYAEVYWERWQAMGLDLEGQAPDELAVRFAAHQPGVGVAIVGTRRVEHLRRAAEAVAKGPLPLALDTAIRERFRAHDQGWVGQI